MTRHIRSADLERDRRLLSAASVCSGLTAGEFVLLLAETNILARASEAGMPLDLLLATLSVLENEHQDLRRVIERDPFTFTLEQVARISDRLSHLQWIANSKGDPLTLPERFAQAMERISADIGRRQPPEDGVPA